jgi:dephospho-CoA kinase
MAGTCPVIGIAGGIGAGKSEVARTFAQLGCVVTDSDAVARKALDFPEVAAKLQSWWGPAVVGADGRIDRSTVARIVFGDAAERRRLEALIHPIVHEARQETIRRARLDGARAVVVDAPLLFEAGVDKECDAVVFVEAPFEQRLARVQRSRHWDEAELKARETAQLTPKEKRLRSDYVINNSGDLADLLSQAAHVLALIAPAC